ncbi:Bax inhibitor-1/YccA family protein [Hymenobacter persicinus]|uniref:Bax inhibitor-1/YccA family protein n=1 Tax=Hymenobacter persicinus TaxID=2025506 RepID=A0A4Q5LED4_9BACT|nr:Bax inhibitor-1/YccA family protein [Hymenobacter persicinus]RYU82145.1 Bax inhibitor-1/YccA family protein [Hymenobacter persicinus]
MNEFLPEEPQALQISPEEAAQIQVRFMTQVYGWMAGALALTGGVAMIVGASPEIQELVFGNRLVFWGLIITELLVVGYLGRNLLEMSVNQAVGAFTGYALLNGITLGLIFMIYTQESIASTFFISGATFGVMSLYGFFTGADLSRWGSLLLMGLIGLVIASVVNMFWFNSTLYWITTFVGVLLFVALIAYDTQKIKMMAFMGLGNDDLDRKTAVWGALSLYLDFINLFLFLLRIFGRRR